MESPPADLALSAPLPSPPEGKGVGRPWAAYVMEAVGLGVFVFFAGLFTVLLFGQHAKMSQLIGTPLGRYAGLGLAMAPVILWGIVKAPWGKCSGAHINPAVTLAYLRLGKISAFDALFYILFQFGGATAMVWILSLLLGAPFTSPSMDYGMNKPGPDGVAVAFVIEFAMTFVLMMLILWMDNDEKLKPKLGTAIAILIGFYLTTATPFTGMSLNPARTTGAAVFASEHPALWIYFVAPIAATLLAAELYRRCWPNRLDGPSYPPPPEPK